MFGIAGLLMFPATAEEVAAKPEARVQSLVREHAAGMKFASIESKGGETFRGVEVTGVTEQAVKFRHAGGEETLAAADCPGLWVELFGLVAEGAPVPAQEVAKTDEAVAKAIAVIEGDRSNGTGFFCKAEGKVYLYTAAHVLSGNSKLSVKMRDGTVVRKFGAVEAAEGADLIRLAVGEAVPHALEIASESGVAKVGIPVLASGNAGGGGTVGFEKGKAILAVQQQSELMIAALSMSKWGSPVFQQQRQDPLSRDITALQSWIEQQQKGGQRFSETDRKKRLRGIFDSARHRSRSQMAAFKSEGFTWFHRESATQETLQRAEIDKVYESTVAELR